MSYPPDRRLCAARLNRDGVTPPLERANARVKLAVSAKPIRCAIWVIGNDESVR